METKHLKEVLTEKFQNQENTRKTGYKLSKIVYIIKSSDGKNDEKIDLTPLFTAEFLFHQIRFSLKKIITDAVITQNIREIIGQMALWFCNDERFKYSLKKGIYLHGTCGTGKTKICDSFVDAIFEIMQIRIRKIHVLELQKLFMQSNDLEIEKLSKYEILIIDDVGVEATEVKYFGTSIQPFIEIFDARYRNEKISIITSNLTASEIKDKYGVRILDRFKETMNDFLLTGESFRK